MILLTILMLTACASADVNVDAWRSEVKVHPDSEAEVPVEITSNAGESIWITFEVSNMAEMTSAGFRVVAPVSIQQTDDTIVRYFYAVYSPKEELEKDLQMTITWNPLSDSSQLHPKQETTTIKVTKDDLPAGMNPFTAGISLMVALGLFNRRAASTRRE